MDSIFEKISSITAHLKNREMARDLMLKNLILLDELFQFSFDLENKLQEKGCWVIEMIAMKKEKLIFPYLDFVLNNYKNLIYTSSKRAISKTLMFIVQKEFKNLSSHQKEKLAELCLDWVISNEKVATQSYLVQILIKLRNDVEWIQQDILSIFQKKLTTQSVSYQSLVKKVFKKINKV